MWIEINGQLVHHLEYKNTVLDEPLADCTKCKHILEYDLESADQYCVLCHQIVGSQEIIEINKDKVKQANIPIWRRDHDRARWTGYLLDYAKGYYNHEIIDSCWKYLLNDIPEVFSWYDIYKIYHYYKLNDYWIGFGDKVGLKIKLNTQILYYADKYTDYRKGKYRISYMYLIYKFTQLFGEPHDERFVPLKGKLTWIIKMDDWWKEFCAKEWFEFKPTKIYYLKWNKLDELQKI